MSPVVMFLLAVLLLAGCGPATVSRIERQKNARQLQPTEVLDLVEGNTLFVRTLGEESYYYFDPSGNLFGQDIDRNEDSGKWDVADTGELCIRFDWWWNGDLRCLTVHTDEQRYYLADPAGIIAYKADLFPGDHKGLYADLSKKRRKSIRRSIRDRQTAPTRGAQDIASAPEPADKPVIPDKPVIVEQGGSAGPSDSELKSTVRWMARDCPGCNLAGTNLNKADLVGARLQGANLSGADLSMANLRRADLQGANLSGADMSYANLPGADLRNCNLTGADLKGANLIQADLTGARLEGTILDEALLEGTRGLAP